MKQSPNFGSKSYKNFSPLNIFHNLYKLQCHHFRLTKHKNNINHKTPQIQFLFPEFKVLKYVLNHPIKRRKNIKEVLFLIQIKNKNESIDKNFLLVQKNFSRKCVVDIKITELIENKIPQLECTTK